MQQQNNVPVFQDIMQQRNIVPVFPVFQRPCFPPVFPVELAKRQKIAQPTVTQSIARGEKIVAEKQLLMTADGKR